MSKRGPVNAGVLKKSVQVRRPWVRLGSMSKVKAAEAPLSPNNARAIVWMVVSVICFSVMSLCVKQASNAGVEPFQIVFARVLLARVACTTDITNATRQIGSNATWPTGYWANGCTNIRSTNTRSDIIFNKLHACADYPVCLLASLRWLH